MAKKVTRKELLKSPDEFMTFSGRAALFVQEHTRQFQYLGMAVAAGILIYLGINAYFDHLNTKGQEAYNEAYYTLIKDAEAAGEDRSALQPSAELFKKVIDDYGASKASSLALPELARIRFQERKYDEAIAHYERFLKETSAGPSYRHLTLLALAACYEEKGEYPRAVDILTQVSTESDDSHTEMAMLSLSRVYRLSGQVEKSNEILEEFTEKFPVSPFLPFAGARIK